MNIGLNPSLYEEVSEMYFRKCLVFLQISEREENIPFLDLLF